MALWQQAWLRFKVTSRRVSVSGGWLGRDRSQVIYSQIKEVRSVARGFGAWGDMVLVLSDGAACLELRAVLRYREMVAFIEDRIGKASTPASSNTNGFVSSSKRCRPPSGTLTHHKGHHAVIGFISDNILLPILDFFYGLVPSYGLAIIALTVVIRLALFPQRRFDPQRPPHAHCPAGDAAAPGRDSQQVRQSGQAAGGDGQIDEGVRQPPLSGLSALAGADADPVCLLRHPAGITVR